MPEVSDLAALAVVIADFHAPEPAALDDAALMDAQRTIAGISRQVDAWAASVAGEIEHRSRRELGHSGLAQRLGARTPERLVQQLTGGSQQQSRTLVRVGALMTPQQRVGHRTRTRRLHPDPTSHRRPTTTTNTDAHQESHPRTRPRHTVKAGVPPGE